jgi:hypothetical protein
MGDGQGLACLDGGVMLEAELFQDEEGAGALERVRRRLGRDDGLDVAELGLRPRRRLST